MQEGDTLIHGQEETVTRECESSLPEHDERRDYYNFMRLDTLIKMINSNMTITTQ